MPWGIICIIIIACVALLMGIGLSRADAPPGRRPSVSRPVPRPTQGPALAPVAFQRRPREVRRG